MPFKGIETPLGDNNTEGRKDLGVSETLEVLEQTRRGVEKSHNKLEQMHEDVEKSHKEEEEALKDFEVIEAELSKRLGDGFEGLSQKDALRVFKVSEKCSLHVISSDPLYLKTREVIEETAKSE